jgi:hypothetical protein
MENGVLVVTDRGARVISSDGLLAATPTSPNSVETHRSPIWKPSCGGRELVSQLFVRISRGALLDGAGAGLLWLSLGLAGGWSGALLDALGSVLGSSALVLAEDVLGLGWADPPPAFSRTHSRQRRRSSAVVALLPAPSSACWLTVPPLVDALAAGASMLLHLLSARWVARRVLASETWVTATTPPKATSVATAAMIRRRPPNPDDLEAPRRYLALRMG